LLHASPQPTSPSRLAELVGTDTAGMTRLDRLEAKGLLRRRRHADDRRGFSLAIRTTRSMTSESSPCRPRPVAG
jgi:DNA-binding MarR family transcriptional regulator